jgi:hypothetical protein
MGLRQPLDRPTSFRAPWQNGCVERLIGSIRRECTDHLIVVNEEHLGRILAKFTAHYDHTRTRTSLGKDAPYTRPIERFGHVVAHPILGGLHHRYARIKFLEATAPGGFLRGEEKSRPASAQRGGDAAHQREIRSRSTCLGRLAGVSGRNYVLGHAPQLHLKRYGINTVGFHHRRDNGVG